MNNPLILIFRLAFVLYVYCIMLRFLFEWMRLDHQNTLAQFIFRITEPPIKYIGKILPETTPIHIRVFIFLIITELVKLALICLLLTVWPNVIGFLGWAVIDLVSQFGTLYIYILFVQVLFSWVMSNHPTPLSYMVYTLTYRVLTIIRRFVPTIYGFDFSPLIAIVLIQLTISFLLNPLTNTLMQWTLS